MPELSNVLRQRLASAAQPEVHPDADTLTAYVEQILGAPERRHVLEHLSACYECREVVLLLTQPAAVDCEPTLVPVRTGRRSWRPAWGLAASLAGLAIVATLIVEMPRGTMEPPHQQGGQAAPVSSPASNQATPALEATATLPATSESRAQDASDGRSRVTTAPAAMARPQTREAVPFAAGPYVNSQMFTNEAGYTNNSYGNNGNVVMSNGVVVSQADLPSAPTPRLSQQSNNLLPGGPVLMMSSPAPYEIDSSKPLRMTTPAPGNGNRFFGLSVVTTLGKDAKQILFRKPTPLNVPAITLSGFADRAMGQPGQFNPASEPGRSEEVTSTFSLNGSSKDAGAAGDLARSGAFTARALGNVQIDGMDAADKKTTAAQAMWKVGDSKLLKLSDSGSWMEGYPSAEGIEFSVVTSHGSDVWAGGSKAALVHSRDGGASWERITLGAAATGIISSIEASGLRVVVRSSSGQSWSSTDGGRIWTLQD